jgi:hypothetical protein
MRWLIEARTKGLKRFRPNQEQRPVQQRVLSRSAGRFQDENGLRLAG